MQGCFRQLMNDESSLVSVWILQISGANGDRRLRSSVSYDTIAADIGISGWSPGRPEQSMEEENQWIWSRWEKLELR